MKHKKYNVITFLLALIISPIIVSIGFLLAKIMNLPILIFSNVLLILFWFVYGYQIKQSNKVSEIISPLLWSFCFYLISWIVTFGLAKYRFDSQYFTAYFFLSLPYIIINFYVSFMNEYAIIPQILTASFVAALLAMLTGYRLSKKNFQWDKKVLTMTIVVIGLSSLSEYQFYDRQKRFLASDSQIDKISDEVDLSNYQPFSQTSLLKVLSEQPTLTISEHFPRLDGATAAYPVYGAVAQEVYKGLNEESVGSYVDCTKTNVAYQRLIDQEIDIFFGAEPSKEQVEAAREKGIEFKLTPIAKEAFVFFVNVDNPVENLTLQQIQDIYQKKITNWKQVGGKNDKILPFQRPINSGSQTIMLAKVMKDKPLPEPLFEEFAAGMGGIISRVASYRNYSSSIGYSFRFYATGMKPNNNIKLLAIDGITPSIENIQNGTYPFTVDVYAVTAGSTNSNTELLIDWLLSEQGQALIEKSGYVKYKK